MQSSCHLVLEVMGLIESLTDKDLNTLKYIAQLRAENLQQAAIAQRLQETSIGEVETLVALQGPSIGPPPQRR